MSDGSAWAREALTFKQIPTLQTLLRCCDEQLLIRVIIDERAARAGERAVLSEKRRRAVEKRLRATIATMCNLSLDKKSARGALLLPDESFVLQARSALIERRVSAALVSLDDVPCVRRVLERRNKAAVFLGAPPGEGEFPQPHPYTLDAWDRTLAIRVWLGGSWCCRERYLVLASAFWDMTYLGFEYERVCARQAEEEALRGVGVGVEDACDEGVACVGAASSRAGSLVGERLLRAQAYGLVQPDRFERDYRDRLAACVARLNEQSRQAFWLRLLDVAARLGRS